MKFQYHNPRDRVESADCVVRSISKAYEISYAVAHEIVRLRTGRMPGCGTSMVLAIGRFPHVEVDTYGLHRPDVQCGVRAGSNQFYPTFAAVAPLLERGSFIVQVKGHVFAVVDGVQYDFAPNGPRKRVQTIYEIR